MTLFYMVFLNGDHCFNSETRDGAEALAAAYRHAFTVTIVEYSAKEASVAHDLSVARARLADWDA